MYTIEWRDISNYQNGEEKFLPTRAWGTDVGSFYLMVMRHEDYPGAWVWCSELTGDKVQPLVSEDDTCGKKEALQLMMNALENRGERIVNAIGILCSQLK